MADSRSLASRVLRDPIHWIPFGCGAGLLPVAPGTWGSLLAALLFWIVPPLAPATHALIVVAGFILGVALCGISSHRLGFHDHPGIVFDEIVAMWAILAVMPRAVVWTVISFFVFRVMDVWKPWPIREADHRIPGGLGIMLDDALAAAFTVAIVLGLWKLSALLH